MAQQKTLSKLKCQCINSRPSVTDRIFVVIRPNFRRNIRNCSSFFLSQTWQTFFIQTMEVQEEQRVEQVQISERKRTVALAVDGSAHSEHAFQCE